MSDKKINTERYFDKRVIRHYYDRKVVTRLEHDKYLDKLEDCAELGEATETRMELSAPAES
jgi:regulator of sigma D